MNSGTIIFFDPYKGFGKIVDDNSGEEFFVHINDLVHQVYKGNKVTYDVKNVDEQLRAYNVKLSTK